MASEFANEVSQRLSQSLTTDENVLHKFMDAAGNLAVNLVVGALILAVTFWASGWASRLARRVLARAQPNGEPDATLASFGGSLARYTVVIVGIVAVLQQLGVQATSILAVLGAASLAIGLALQGALSNVAAGVMLLLFRPYRVGDVVEIGGRTGVIRALDLFVTELSTADNSKVVLPNSKVFGDVIVNTSFHERRRVDVVFRVKPEADLMAVLAGLKARAGANPLVLKDPEPFTEVTGLSELFAEGAVHAWVERKDYQTVRSDLLLAARLLIEGKPDALPAPPAPKPAKAPAPRKRGLAALRKPGA